MNKTFSSMVILSDIQSNKWIFNQYTFNYLFVFIFRCILWSVHDWSWLLHAEVWAVEDWWHQTQCHMVSSCKPLYLHGCLNNWILGCAMGHDWRAIPNQSRFNPEFWTHWFSYHAVPTDISNLKTNPSKPVFHHNALKLSLMLQL